MKTPELWVGRPRKPLPGYLNLAGQLPITVARELPIFLAQPDIALVRIFLGSSVPYARSVRCYSGKPFVKPVYVLSHDSGQRWCYEIFEQSEQWSRLCFPGKSKLASYKLLGDFDAILTFYHHGRLRLNFGRGHVAAHWYAAGHWRDLNEQA